jgi:hypothetical protein
MLFKLEWEFVQFFGPRGMFEMILFLTNQKHQLFAGYPYGYTLDPYVVLSPTSEGAACHGFWV